MEVCVILYGINLIGNIEEDIMSNIAKCNCGGCDDCIYYEYQSWLEEHLHCDQESWTCPNELDCPYRSSSPICWVGVSDEEN